MVDLALEHELWMVDAEELPGHLTGRGVKDEALRRKLALIDAAMSGSRFSSANDLKRWLGELERADVDHILHPTVPFMGMRMDVNDVGALGGISLAILISLLLSSIAGEFENVQLAMWKVRRVVEQEDAHQDGTGKDNNNSRANLLYHALAMAQVLSRPPTLIRWRRRPTHGLIKILFVAPLLVQLMVFWQDWVTRQPALILNPQLATLNLAISGTALVVLALLTTFCLVYSRALDLAWRETFFTINPDRRDRPQDSWLRYVSLLPKKTQSVEEATSKVAA